MNGRIDDGNRSANRKKHDELIRAEGTCSDCDERCNAFVHNRRGSEAGSFARVTRVSVGRQSN